VTSSYLQLEEVHPGMLLLEYGDDSRRWYVMVLESPVRNTIVTVFDFRLGHKAYRNSSYFLRSRVQK